MYIEAAVCVCVCNLAEVNRCMLSDWCVIVLSPGCGESCWEKQSHSEEWAGVGVCGWPWR